MNNFLPIQQWNTTYKINSKEQSALSLWLSLSPSLWLTLPPLSLSLSLGVSLSLSLSFSLSLGLCHQLIYFHMPSIISITPTSIFDVSLNLQDNNVEQIVKHYVVVLPLEASVRPDRRLVYVDSSTWDTVGADDAIGRYSLERLPVGEPGASSWPSDGPHPPALWSPGPEEHTHARAHTHTHESTRCTRCTQEELSVFQGY